MLSEIALGGELFHRIYPPLGGDAGLKEEDAVFYAASVTSALGYMHSREVKYTLSSSLAHFLTLSSWMTGCLSQHITGVRSD